MHVWLDQSEAAVNSLVGARNTIAAAASRRDIPATGTACRSATDAVATLREHMPSPEAAVNSALQQAISNYTIGLPDCISASRTVDGEGMQRAARFISQGDDAMQLALDILGDEASPRGESTGDADRLAGVSRWCARSGRRSWPGWRPLQVSRTPAR